LFGQRIERPLVRKDRLFVFGLTFSSFLHILSADGDVAKLLACPIFYYKNIMQNFFLGLIFFSKSRILKLKDGRGYCWATSLTTPCSETPSFFNSIHTPSVFRRSGQGFCIVRRRNVLFTNCEDSAVRSGRSFKGFCI